MIGVLLAQGIYVDSITCTSASLVDEARDRIPGMLRDDWNLWCYHTQGKSKKFDFFNRYSALRTVCRFIPPRPLEITPYGNEQNQLEAFRSTLVLGDAEQQGKKLFYISDSLGVFATIFDYLGFLDKDLPAVVIDDNTCPILSTARNVERIINGVPRFFITQSGYMGRGPHALQVGDIITILLGGEVPFVVRKVGERYILIGECCK
jgi:hypothetical protein